MVGLRIHNPSQTTDMSFLDPVQDVLATPIPELYDPAEESKQQQEAKRDDLIRTIQSLAKYTQGMSSSGGTNPTANPQVPYFYPGQFMPPYQAPQYYYAPQQPYIHPQRSVPDIGRPSEAQVLHIANQMCREFSRKGTCQFESTCRWFHVLLPQRICYTFLLKGSCIERECRFAHFSAEKLYEYMKVHHPSILKDIESKQYHR